MPNPSQLSKVGGVYVAAAFNTWKATVYSGFTGTGAQSATLFQNGWVTLKDGTLLSPFSTHGPLIFDAGEPNQETVTPTSVSSAVGYNTTEPPSFAISATFTYSHGRGAIVKSASFGLQEALDYAAAQGGGIVVVDSDWVAAGGTSVILAAAILQTGTQILDARGTPRFVPLRTSTSAVAALTTNGAIDPNTAATYSITKAGVLADTLAAPTTITDDGKVIMITSATANAHTITATGLYLNAAGTDVGTFAATVGKYMIVYAVGAKWWVLASSGVTFT